jgi:hypothetical protein
MQTTSGAVKVASDPIQNRSVQEVLEEMATTSRRRLPALLCLPVLAGAVVLGACGTATIDPKSGEKLIRRFVQQNSGTAKKVSCPSDVKQQNGQFDCKVTVQDSSGSTRSGTITIHLTQGGHHGEIQGVQDIHIQ